MKDFFKDLFYRDKANYLEIGTMAKIFTASEGKFNLSNYFYVARN